MKKTRLVSALLCSAMVFSLFTGCSKSNQTSGNNSTPAPSSGPEDWGQIRIAVNIGGTAFEVPEEDKIVEENLQKMILKDCNAKIDFEIVYLNQAQAKQQLQMKVAAGETIDLAAQTWDTTEGFMQPLDDLLNKYGQNILKRIPEKEWKMVTINGKKMAFTSGVGEESINGGLAIRKDLLDKAGLKVPTNLNELETALAKFKEMGYIPMAAFGVERLYITFGGLFADFIGQKSVDVPVYVDKSGNVMPDFLTSARLECDKMLNKWVKNGWLTKDFVTLNNQTMTALVNTGKVASFIENNVGIGNQNIEPLMSVDKNAVLVHVPFMGTKAAINPAGSNACLTPTTKNAVGLIKYLNWCYADYKNFVNAAYGIDGIQRIYDWDKMTMQYPDKYTQPNAKKYGARSFVGMLMAEKEFNKKWGSVLAPNATDAQKAQYTYSGDVWKAYQSWPDEKKSKNDFVNYNVNVPADVTTSVRDTLFKEILNKECAFIIDGNLDSYQKTLDNLKKEWESKYMKTYTDAYKKAAGK